MTKKTFQPTRLLVVTVKVLTTDTCDVTTSSGKGF